MQPVSRRRFLAATVGAGAGLAGAALWPAKAALAKARPIGDEGVGPAEDLMREHGILRRILLVYDEAGRRVGAGEQLPAEALAEAARMVQKVVHDYHEKLEEDAIFPLFERASRRLELIGTLRAQHAAGRRITEALLKTITPQAMTSQEKRALVSRAMDQFSSMYRPHAAREDTSLFPVLRQIVTRKEYLRLGEQFEAMEQQRLGEMGFERSVEQVAGIEGAFGLSDLSRYTPTAY